ncbi:ankyrin repeat-containing domain protein [Lophiotrema nucula]|uniref:Ankyrin repeat-containing domain protein n=1 Tax=Lophiotrema nucula TaxID=690887 RepID=A0A6A5YQ12_9PLEO|nr:ankyrin repeat-containing domain protein [Lophiotrema nucula]
MTSKLVDHIATQGGSKHQSHTKRKSRERERLGHGKRIRRNDGTPSIMRHENEPGRDPTMCADCQKIDFNSIFYEHTLSSNKKQPGYVVAALTHLNPSRSNDCRCCSILVSIAQSNLYEDSDLSEVEYHLIAYSTVKNLAPNLKTSLGHHDKPLLTVLAKSVPLPWTRTNSPRKFFVIVPHDSSPELYRPQIRPVDPSVDWKLVREWLEYCHLNHEASCQADGAISSLRVIDCRNPDDPRLVDLLEANGQYVALSYVWGDQNSANSDHNLSIQSAPLVIKDAMEVVRCLGFEFLWVDRYCIPQYDEYEKHRLIRNMNDVYMGASLTIIAAAGDGPHSGLPGVTRYRHGTGVQFESFSLVPFDLEGSLIVNKSRWSSRAWTYQEDVLSKRKLYFTEEGLYYQCQSMTHTENVILPLHLGSIRRGYPQWPKSTPVLPLISLEQSFSLESFDYRVSEYHNRQLSFDSDALHAFKGVFQHFHNVSGMRHLWGVPLKTLDVPSLVLGLSWHCLNCEGGERRYGFPSWSWAGWKKHQCEGFRCLSSPVIQWSEFVTYWTRPDVKLPAPPAPGIEIAVEVDSGSGLNRNAYDWGQDALKILWRAERDREPPRLRIRATIAVNPSLHLIDTESDYGSWPRPDSGLRQGRFYKSDISWEGGSTWKKDERTIKLVLLSQGWNPKRIEQMLYVMSELGSLCAKEFLHNLSADEQGLFRAATIAESLLKETESADADHKDASWSRKASASLLPFIAGIEQYGPAWDVFANSNDLLCPVLGSFDKDFGEYFDRVAGMLEEIGNILLRLPRAMRLYPDNKHLQKAVLAIYQDIFEFTSRARDVSRVGKNRSHWLFSMKHVVGFVATLRLVWKPFDVQFGAIKKRILKNVGDIETGADIAEKELAQQERQKDNVRWSKAEASQRMLADFIDEQSVVKVNEWLSPANIAPNHKVATNLRHGESGTWFLQGESFQRFLDEENSFLCLHALPGAGKTVLASSIINYLQDHVQSKSKGLAYFYCDYKEVQKQEPSKFLDADALAEPLRAASSNGHVEATKVLLEYMERTSKGMTEQHHSEEELPVENTEKDSALQQTLAKALYLASAKGHTSVISLLLRHKAPVNARGGRDGTALQAAALEGRANAVKLLLDSGASHWEACKRYGTPLAAAAEKAHQRTAGVLIDYGASPNSHGGWYSLPLVSAIVGKNLNLVRRLVEADADGNAVEGCYGWPLPAAAAALGMNSLIEEPVGYGANVNDNDDKASDALYAASLAGHVSTVDLLLKLGADVNAKGGRLRNALGAASSEGHFEVVEMLLDAGADVDYFDEHWGNALQTAAQRGHEEVVKLLADAGVDPNSPGDDKGTALVGAASNGNNTVIKCPFELKVPSGPTSEMTTALVAAAGAGRIETVNVLIDSGADANGLANPSQTASYCTPLQAAASKGHHHIGQASDRTRSCSRYSGRRLVRDRPHGGRQDHDALVDLALARGAEINLVREPLDIHDEIESCLLPMVRMLLRAGADINTPPCGMYGYPLQAAIERKRPNVARYLTNKGAEVKAKGGCFGGVLNAAALNCNETFLERLLKEGVNVDEGGARYATPLQAAACEGRLQNVMLLLRYGAEVNRTGGRYHTALQAACAGGRLTIAKLLVERGADPNVTGGRFRTALTAATIRGNEKLDSNGTSKRSQVAVTPMNLLARGGLQYENSVSTLYHNDI